MRELKFRMVTQTTGKFLGYADIYDLLRNGSDVLPDFEEAVLEGAEFEQYTGLKDKNGEEIYEGDIVRRCEEGGFNDIVGVVEWSEKSAKFWVERYYYLNGKNWVVIGNIHENPELLGGKE